MNRYRMMVCDDDEGYRMLVKTVMRDAAQGKGHDVEFVEARDGKDCVEGVTESAPDCVLLDLEMPGANGWETLPRLRKVIPTGKIVVLSSSAAEESSDTVLKLGADAFVQKPRDIFLLPGLIAEQLGCAARSTAMACGRPAAYGCIAPSGSSSSRTLGRLRTSLCRGTSMSMPGGEGRGATGRAGCVRRWWRATHGLR
jgi:CheY-like chemotaxis protein